MTTVDRVHAAGYDFAYAFDISPLRDDDGNLWRDLPHERYAKKAQSRLLPGGEGPFCRFDCPPGLDDAGVYLIVSDRQVCYVGQTTNGLSERFGATAKGYGRIAPRNCYRGGEPTNVRVNGLLFGEADLGRRCSVWFLPVALSDLDVLEDEIKQRFSPPWNVS